MTEDYEVLKDVEMELAFDTRRKFRVVGHSVVVYYKSETSAMEHGDYGMNRPQDRFVFLI